jgi:hypothetical protein
MEDVEKIVKGEVLKREIVEGDEADSARTRVAKFYRKGAAPRTAKKVDEPAATLPPSNSQESVTERLLREAEDKQPDLQSPSSTEDK